MTQNAKRTATETYAKRRRDIARLVEVLELELGKYDQRAAAEPKNWGYAGTLDYIRTSLIEAIEGISGRERDEIERFLAEEPVATPTRPATSGPAAAATSPDRVRAEDACPRCGNAEIDELIIDPDTGNVRCAVCDKRYNPTR